MLNSMGWILIILSLIFLFVKQAPDVLIVTVFGAGIIWLQLRGKRISLNTTQRTVRSEGKMHKIKKPERIFMNKVVLSQTVNARVNSTNVRMYFYKAYLLDGEEKILISSNRKEERDMAKLKAIADELRVELVKNY